MNQLIINSAARLAVQTQATANPDAEAVAEDHITSAMFAKDLPTTAFAAVSAIARLLWEEHLQRRQSGLALLQRCFTAENANYIGDKPAGFIARRDKAALLAVTLALEPKLQFSQAEIDTVRNVFSQWIEDCGSDDVDTHAVLDRILTKLAANIDLAPGDA